MEHSPHLPKRDHAHERATQARMHRIAWLTIAVVVVLGIGAVGGFVARMLTTNIIEKPTEVFVTQDVASVVASIDTSILHGVLPVYTKRNTNSNNFLQTLYIDDRDRLGFAVAITNDGWIMTTGDVLSNTNAVIPLGNGVLASITELVRDPVTDLVFAKINATSLTAVPLARITTEDLTEIAAVPTAHGPLRAMIIDAVSNFACENTSCLTQNAGSFASLGYASPYYQTVSIGHPILNRRGEVLGIITEIDQEANAVRFVPASVVSPVLDDLFTQSVVRRVALPFDYVALSSVTSSDALIREDGILVTRVLARATDDFPLQKDDTIIALGGVAIDAQQTFASLLFTYPVGTTVQMQIVRDTQELTIDVPLIAAE